MMAKVIIYKPCKTATQSGKAKTHAWHVKFISPQAKYLYPTMGWMGSSDTTHQIDMEFISLEEATQYAIANNLDYEVIQDNKSSEIQPKSYLDNFKFTGL